MVDQAIDPPRQARRKERASAMRSPLPSARLRAAARLDEALGEGHRLIMRNDVLPALGDRAVKDVDHADVAALHRRSASGHPARATGCWRSSRTS